MNIWNQRWKGPFRSGSVEPPEQTEILEMLQLVATMISLLLAIGAGSLIAATLADDWPTLRHALGFRDSDAVAALPRRTRQLVAVRRARIVRVSPAWAPLRAAA